MRLPPPSLPVSTVRLSRRRRPRRPHRRPRLWISRLLPPLIPTFSLRISPLRPTIGSYVLRNRSKE